MLGTSQKKILEWLTKHGPATPKVVGAALYDSTSSCAGTGPLARQTELTRTNWARNILKKLSTQGLVVVVGMDESSKANLFSAVEVDRSITLQGRVIKNIENEVKNLLHASRDCLRSKGVDTTQITFSVQDGYYGEAFGVMRCLQVMGVGSFGSDNTPEKRSNLKWWFRQLEAEVLKEENFQGSNECDHCLERYGKDAVRKRSSEG